MKITPDIIRYEFIGTKGLVSASSNSNLIGINGFVVGETRNTFILQDEGSTWNVLKEASTFNFTFNDGTVVAIDGKLLVGRSEDRLKKNVKRLW